MNHIYKLYVEFSVKFTFHLITEYLKKSEYPLPYFYTELPAILNDKQVK